MKRLLLRLSLGGLVVVIALVAWRLIAQSSGEADLVPMVAAVVAADSEFDPCLECHNDIEQSLTDGSVRLVGFSHEGHFSISGDVGCGNCHGLDAHDRTPPRTPSMDDCFSCHVGEGPAPELPCLRCHDNATVSPPQSHFTSEWGNLHSSAALLNQSLCETCHSRETFCTTCHGVEIPHAEDWAGFAHARAMFDAGIDSCIGCHERGPELTTRDECDACHHPQNPEVPLWREAHPDVVKDTGGVVCFECHDSSTCATCHMSGVEDYTADLNRLDPPTEETDKSDD